MNPLELAAIRAFGRPIRSRTTARAIRTEWPTLTARDRMRVRETVTRHLAVTGGMATGDEAWISLIGWIGDHTDSATTHTPKGPL